VRGSIPLGSIKKSSANSAGGFLFYPVLFFNQQFINIIFFTKKLILS